MSYESWFKEYFNLKNDDDYPDKADFDPAATKAAYEQGLKEGKLDAILRESTLPRLPSS